MTVTINNYMEKKDYCLPKATVDSITLPEVKLRRVIIREKAKMEMT